MELIFELIALTYKILRSFVFNVNYAVNLFRRPVEEPLSSWDDMAQGTIIISFCFVFFVHGFGLGLHWYLHSTQCAKRSACSKHLGRREVLQRLLEARTPNYLWYDVKMMCLRDGVQTREEEERSPRFEGFSVWSSTEASRQFRKVWELGRASIIRELIEMETVGEQLDEIIKLYKTLNVELDEVMGKPPLYEQ